MSGQLQFGGTIPFPDRQSGGQIQVRVWGVYIGQGVDAHEQNAIQQWIMNALATSAAQYDGNVYELPQKAVEWGSWVSQQIAPGLAQSFQAHGQIQIQGVSIEGAGGGKPMAQQAAHGGMSGGSVLDKAANAISQQLGVPHAQAMQAAQIVMQVLEVEGGMGKGAMAADPYAQKKADPYAQKKADPYAQKKADPYAQKKADPYAQKKPDPYKQPAKQADPYKKKDDPWKK